MLFFGKKRKLAIRRLQGLSMIRDGMRIQLEHVKAIQETQPNSCDLVRVLEYWLNEVEEAINGNRHY